MQPNSQVRNANTLGALKLTLGSGGYDWRFLPQAGKTFTDAGSAACHGRPSPTSVTSPSSTTTRPPAPSTTTTRPRPSTTTTTRSSYYG